MPKVSIVIPVYNIGNVLVRCLDSVLGQTHKNLQIILIDDGSSDNSLAVCKQYAEKDSRIEVYHHKNHGVSYTRNVGILRASGDYIIFIDGDDTISNTYIADLVNEAESNSADIVLCGIQRVRENQEVETMRLKNTLPDKKAFWEFCCTTRSPLIGYAPNKLYRLSLIKENGLLFNTAMHAQEDLNFALQAYSCANCIHISDVCGYSYYYAPGKRHMPIEDLITNQILLYQNARAEHVSTQALKKEIKNIYSLLFAYIASIPPISHIKKVRNIPNFDKILNTKHVFISIRHSLIVYLFRKSYFAFALSYIKFEKMIKKIISDKI